jgi:hypothetical protein
MGTGIVMGFTADAGIADIRHAGGQVKEAPVAHGGANLVRHEPGGLVGDVQHPHQ